MCVQVSLEGATLRELRPARLVEPVCVAAANTSRCLAVADNGARAVFLLDERGNIQREVRDTYIWFSALLALSLLSTESHAQQWTIKGLNEQ